MSRYKIAYVSVYDSNDVHNWSGLGYYIAKSLEKNVGDLDYVGNLKTRRFIEYEIKKAVNKLLFNKKFESKITPRVAKNYADQIARRIKDKKFDLIFCPGTVPISMLKTDTPIIIWTDSCQPGLLDFYDSKDKFTEESFVHGVEIEKLALDNSALAIFSSDWAASIATNYHKINPAKVKVVPFGANVDSSKSEDEISKLISTRQKDFCKLLFVGVDWKRKGGDIAFKTAEGLIKKGLRTELTIVGCEPIIEKPLPDFVKSLGFISKSTDEGKQKINKLFQESHFLIVPSQAEAYGLVFCEANSFGVPAIATNVGGISTIIKNNINGRSFSPNAQIDEYVDFIFGLMKNSNEYKRLALSSFNEFRTRLNWDTAGQAVKRMIDELLIKNKAE